MLLRNWLDGFLCRFSRISWRRSPRRAARVLKQRNSRLRAPEALEVRTLLSASTATLKLQTGGANPLNGQDAGSGCILTIGDITGDGLADVIVGRKAGNFVFYKNTGTATIPAYTLQSGAANPLNGLDVGAYSAPALGDLNGDGLLDLISGVDNGTFVYYRNTGTATHPAFTLQAGAANPLNLVDIGISSIPALGDLNGDGLLDLIAGNDGGTFTYFKNTGTAASPAFTQQSGAANPLNGQVIGTYSIPALGDLNGDGVLDLIAGRNDGTFVYYQNTGSATNPAFTPQTGAANPLDGQNLGAFSAPALKDLNGDGRPDLLAQNLDGFFTYYMNVGPIRPTLPRQYGAANPLDAVDLDYYSSPTLGDLTGDGLPDLITGNNGNTLRYYKNTGTRGNPIYTLQTGANNPFNGVDQTVATPTLGDLNGDGLLDLIVGNLYGTFNYYKNTGTAANPVFTLQTGAANPLDGVNVFSLSAPSLGDLNGDGLLDLIVGSGSGTFSYFKNTGTAANPVFTLQSGANNPLNGQYVGNDTLPSLGDLNGDGRLDLLVGNQDGIFTYYQNTGTATNPVLTVQQNGWNPLNGQDVGGRSAPALADLNGDGALDVIAGNHDGKFVYYKNVPVPIVPRLIPQTGAANPLNGQDVGFTATPTTGDLNGDGLLDLISGISDGTLLYFLNTGSPNAPAFTLQTGAANPLNGQDVGRYATPALKDLTGDGLLDLVVGNYHGTFSFYKNTGTAATPAFTLQTGAADPLNGQDVGYYSAPALADLNGDGLADLVVGSRYGVFSYYKNTGTAANPVFTLQTGAANPLDGQNGDSYATASLKDLDGDGLTDLVVGNNYGSFKYYKNTGTTTVPVFTLQTGAANPLNGLDIGSYAAPSLQDLDADGRPDLIVGENRGVFFYYRSLPQTAPVLNPTIHHQVNIDEDIADFANSGLLLSDIITTTFGSDNWSDVDPAALQGIAIIAANNSLGNWQYSTNGGTNWTNIGNRTTSSAFLLANNANTRIRLAPFANANGTVPNGLTFVAWDQTTGSNLGTADASVRGGASAFSTAAATINLTINAVNDPPVLNTAGNPRLPTIDENDTTTTGILVSDLIASMGPSGGITDVDAGALQGITITGYGGTFQSWQYSLDNGSSWNGFPTTFPYNVLLASDTNTRIRYLPAPNEYGSFLITFRAWDQTSGVNGQAADANTGASAFSSNEEIAYITVNPVNDAPVLNTAGNPTLPTIAEDATTNTGILVSGLITSMGPSGGITDADVGALKGIAITAEDGSQGTWQYSLNNGSSWTTFPAGISNSFALLLASDANTRIRFLPALNYNGNASISFRAWDQTAGVNGGTADASINGGTTAFSSGSTESAKITITAVNDAPVLNNAGSPALTAILPNTPDASNPGTSILQILANMTATSGSIADPDVGAVQGIAISSVDNSHGTWQFTTNNGTLWTDFGTPTASAARLLAANSTTKIRFKPTAGYVGSPTFLFVAWDQTAGTNGGTASITSRGGDKPYSLVTDTGSITVNTAPEMTSTGTPTLVAIPRNVADASNPGTTVTQIIASMISSGGSYTEADPGSLQGIAVTVIDQTHGTWQFTINNGTTWTDFGSTSASNARLLIATASTKIRFKPAVDYVGNATFVFTAWDVSSGTNGGTASAVTRGGARSFSTGYDTATINVFIPNSAPILNAAGNPTLSNIAKNVADAANTGTLVSDIIANLTSSGGSITDPDPGALQGLAITSAVQTNGTWQYTINGGTTWIDFGAPTAATARLLASDANTRIRFKPAANYTGTATFLFVAWDQSSGVNGGTLSATTRGGLKPFSTATDTAKITVTP